MAQANFGNIAICPSQNHIGFARGQSVWHTAGDDDIQVFNYNTAHDLRNNISRPTWEGLDGKGLYHFGWHINQMENITANWLVIVDVHNIHSTDGRMGSSHNNAGTTNYGSKNFTPVFNCTDDTNYVIPDGDEMFCAELSGTDMSGMIFAPLSGDQWDGEPYVSRLFFGQEFELSSNCTASSSIKNKSYNTLLNSLGGKTYSVLYNTDSQRVISLSWEYVGWDSGGYDGTRGIGDFDEMLGLCYGSHIPVALIFDRDNLSTNKQNGVMFGNITKWDMTQISPTLWGIDAEITELI